MPENKGSLLDSANIGYEFFYKNRYERLRRILDFRS